MYSLIYYEALQVSSCKHLPQFSHDHVWNSYLFNLFMGVSFSVETYTLEVMFIVTLLSLHILVAVWAGYTLTKHTLTRFGYQFHDPGFKVAVSNMANGVRLCLCRRHRGYQEMCPH